MRAAGTDWGLVQETEDHRVRFPREEGKIFLALRRFSDNVWSERENKKMFFYGPINTGDVDSRSGPGPGNESRWDVVLYQEVCRVYSLVVRER